MHVRLCGQWDMDISDDSFAGVDNRLGSLSPFLRSMVLRGDDVARDVYCYHDIIQHLADNNGVTKVCELFAGVGLMTMLIRHMIDPLYHWVSDIDAHCVAHLQSVFGSFPYTQIAQLDALELKSSELMGFDFVSLDYNASYGKLRNAKSLHSKVLDATTLAEVRYIHMTDKSVAYFGVNRRKYEALMNCRIDNVADFLMAESEFFFKEYGYSMTRALYHSCVAHLLLEPTVRQRYPDIIHVTGADHMLELDGVDSMKAVVQ